MGDMNNVLLSLAEVMSFIDNSKIDVFTDEKIYENSIQKFKKLNNVNYHFEKKDHILKEAEMDRLKNIQTYSMPELPLKKPLIEIIVKFIEE